MKRFAFLFVLSFLIFNVSKAQLSSPNPHSKELRLDVLHLVGIMSLKLDVEFFRTQPGHSYNLRGGYFNDRYLYGGSIEEIYLALDYRFYVNKGKSGSGLAFAPSLGFKYYKNDGLDVTIYHPGSSESQSVRGQLNAWVMSVGTNVSYKVLLSERWTFELALGLSRSIFILPDDSSKASVREAIENSPNFGLFGGLGGLAIGYRF